MAQRMDLETALETVELLRSRDRIDEGSLTVHTGVHPDYGPVHVVLSPFGDAILLSAAPID